MTASATHSGREGVAITNRTQSRMPLVAIYLTHTHPEMENAIATEE